MVLSRVFSLSREQQVECRLLVDSGVLNSVVELYRCSSYREAFLIHKGLLVPGDDDDVVGCTLERWL